jgi:phage replication O-like protein O
MTNILSLSKAQGFTRMDNKLYESLIGAELSGRELRVALAIHRFTAGFNVDEARVYAGSISKLSGIARENVSRMISELLRQRVIYRHGGSKDPIGFNDPSLWVIDSKSEASAKIAPTRGEVRPFVRATLSVKNDTVSETTQCVENDPSLVSETTHIKDNINTNTKTLGSFPAESKVEQPAEKPATKKSRKAPFGKTQLLANNPHDLTDQLLDDWIALRDSKRSGITPTVWAGVNRELGKCVDAGIDAPTAMAEGLIAGWQGFRADWLINRLKGKAGRSNDEFDSTSTDWIEDMCQ